MNIMIIMAVLAFCWLLYFVHIEFCLFKIFMRNITRSRMWADGAIKILISAPSLLVNGLRNTEHKKTGRFECKKFNTDFTM